MTDMNALNKIEAELTPIYVSRLEDRERIQVDFDEDRDPEVFDSAEKAAAFLKSYATELVGEKYGIRRVSLGEHDRETKAWVEEMPTWLTSEGDTIYLAEQAAEFANNISKKVEAKEKAKTYESSWGAW